MASQLLLIKAIRSGKLDEVLAAIDAGAPVHRPDDNGEPGLPMGIACFMGFADIVRTLAGRGALVNAGDNTCPTSPLQMAVRGKRKEVVRTLLELGADLPPGLDTGLSEQEITVAQWVFLRNNPGAEVSPETPLVEEIDVGRCAGTDTQVLEADVIRAARNLR